MPDRARKAGDYQGAAMMRLDSTDALDRFPRDAMHRR